ncbi:MAG: bifunctional YncE family protein/alkaline phosphatase family protein, partial [Acidobacteriota bacterium]|nr:bifunctional YncE family protein/alkaline phosphatase family protein [Acidobacteriota bacterium]
SGRVRLMDLATGDRRKSISINQGGFHDSFTGDIAWDAERGILYVLDQANFRMVSIDARKNRILASAPVGRLPFAIALSSDRRHVYVTNLGMFQYRAIPGALPGKSRETGLPFPAFGFPSPEAQNGAKRTTAVGEIDVPGLGDPNVRESNSLTVLDVNEPANPRMERFIRTGLPFGKDSAGGSGPSGVLEAAGRVFVSNGHNDSITVIDAKTGEITGEIAIRIPGLETLRGVLPLGMAYDSVNNWLLVAEAGLNAIGVIDVGGMRVIGHIPADWFPTRLLVREGTVYVANAKGHGTGPNLPGRILSGNSEGLLTVFRRGSVTNFVLPTAAELPKHTGVVFSANGLIPRASVTQTARIPVKHVVLIVKENRTFDEVFGDITNAANGPVLGAPVLARFGRLGHADGDNKRLSLQHVDVTPNHHEMAAQWSFSDNFYADSEVSVDGHHWLVGSYPDAWTESSLLASYADGKRFRFPTAAPGRLLFAQSNSSVHPEEQGEGGTIWHHFERHGVAFRNFGEGFELAGNDEGTGLKPTGARLITNVPMPDPLYRNTSREYPGFNMNIPDQFRASQFIHEVEQKYVKGGEPFPQFVFIHLPNDHMAAPRPEDGYPYAASFEADNDYALGKIVDYLSNSPWWREMAIFVTEDDAQGGFDHVDSHRTVLLAAGPYFKKNYASHRNTSFPGLLKTIFGILGVPPLNLFDASASDLSDMFTPEPDFTPYHIHGIDPRLFNPERAREPLDPKPSPRMDRQ